MFTGNTLALSALASATGARVLREAQVGNVGKVPTRLSDRLVYAAKPEHLADLEAHEGIAAVLVPPDMAELVPISLGLAVADHPARTAIEIFEGMIARPGFHWADFPTRIAPSARIHPRAIVAEQNVVIGENSFVDAGTVIRERTIIGADCYVGALSVLGAEAFDLAAGVRPRRLLRQAGGVRMANNSTVLSSTTIVRATFGGFTEIREGACIDNLVYIAHDVDVGKDCTVVAGAAVTGRVVLGEGSYIGPNAAISNGLTIGRGATATLGAAVTRDVPDNTSVSGVFAIPHDRWIEFIKSVASD